MQYKSGDFGKKYRIKVKKYAKKIFSDLFWENNNATIKSTKAALR